MNNKTIFWTLGGIATAIVGYMAYKKITAPTITFGDVEDEVKEIPTRVPVKQTPKESFPLQRGSRGKNVEKLQSFLVSQGYQLGNFGKNNNGIDGVFGQKTESAVRMNQQPFEVFKNMYPQAERGKVSKEFFDLNIRNNY